MKVNDRTKRSLAYRRQKKSLETDGYFYNEVDWWIHRGYGSIIGATITDVKVAVDGKGIYYKLSHERQV